MDKRHHEPNGEAIRSDPSGNLNHDFYHRVEVRQALRGTIVGLSVGLGLISVMAIVAIVMVDAPASMALILIGPLAMVLLLFLPMWFAGGAYIVSVRGGILKVESPPRQLGSGGGPSFNVHLKDIARLVAFDRDVEDPLGYGIVTTTGETFPLNTRLGGRNALPVEELFQTIERLRGLSLRN